MKKTYFLDYIADQDDELTAIFVNDEDLNDTINLSELMCFDTAWSGKKEDYKDTEGYFEGCNCFMQQSYSIEFFRLSNCGHELTNF